MYAIDTPMCMFNMIFFPRSELHPFVFSLAVAEFRSRACKRPGWCNRTTNWSFYFFERTWENTFINAGSTREKAYKSSKFPVSYSLYLPFVYNKTASIQMSQKSWIVTLAVMNISATITSLSIYLSVPYYIKCNLCLTSLSDGIQFTLFYTVNEK